MIVPVVTGFIGHDPNGKITTLGRGNTNTYTTSSINTNTYTNTYTTKVVLI